MVQFPKVIIRQVEGKMDELGDVGVMQDQRAIGWEVT